MSIINLYCHLVGSGVDGCQLSLIIEHLLKVRNMPELVSGVAMEPLLHIYNACVMNKNLMVYTQYIDMYMYVHVHVYVHIIHTDIHMEIKVQCVHVQYMYNVM